MNAKIHKSLALAGMLIMGGASVANAQSYDNPQDSILKSLELEAVEVVAQKPLVKMDTDKLTYDVSLDTDAKASTVLDMLRKVPMVTVDGQDNITVNGSSAFKIYVDGKPNVMFSSNPSQIFKAMPATMVSKIEVVTNPGAKYDAEGVGGVLNIMLNHAGIAGAGQASAGVNGVMGNVRLQAGNKGFGGGAFLNGQMGRFSFSANAMINRAVMNGTELEMVQNQLGDVPSSSTMLQHGGKTRTPFSMANLSLGYELDDWSTLNATLGFTAFQTRNDGTMDNILSGTIYGPGMNYSMFNKMRNKKNGLNFSADYQRFLNKDRTSNITITYLFSRDPSNSSNYSLYDHSAAMPGGFDSFLQDRYSDSHDRQTENTLQVDLTSPLAEGHALNYGAKVTSHVSHSESDFFFLDADENKTLQPDLSSDYKNTKSIAAGYAEYEASFGKVGTRAGLRYEHTWQSVDYISGNGSDYDSNYGNFIPSLSLSYRLAPIANVGLTYNLRISRPGITYLNPYVDRSNNTALTYGNPDLDVEQSHNIGMVANFFTPVLMFNANLKYAHTGNAIEQYSFYDADNKLNTTYGNIVKRDYTSFTLFMSYLLHKNTRLFTNAGIGYNNLKSAQLDASNGGWQWNAMVGIQQTLPLDIKLGGYLISNSKTYTLQGWSTGFNLFSANITKSFFQEKLTVGLQGVTGLSKGGKLHIDTHALGKDFSNDTKIAVPLSSINLTVAYNFGNSKVKARQHESKAKSDFIDRSSDMEKLSNQMQQQ